MPKPLQLTLLSSSPLGDSISPTSASPTLHSLPSGSATPPVGYRRPANLRRQSSISYITSPTSSPKTPSRHAVTRSMSYGSPISPRPVVSSPVESNGRTRSPSSASKGPLTLAEKHADLLSEMAAKESLCLELKSQLATHEAELQILKEKWHKLINEGDTENKAEDLNQAPEKIITGLKDGMNSMGKYIAAGISEFAPVVSPTPPRIQATPMVRRTHSSKASVSSSSTSSNSSGITRLSESSASSVEDTASPADEHADAQDEKRDIPQPLPKMGMRITSPPSSPLNPTSQRHTKRRSMTADFPVPGMGIASLISTPAVSGWLANIGNKWDDLQKSDTYTKGHERATSLMNDITQTFTQAFPPQPSLSVPSSSSSGSLVDSSTLTPIPELHSTVDAGSQGQDTSALMETEPDDSTDEWNW